MKYTDIYTGLLSHLREEMCEKFCLVNLMIFTLYSYLHELLCTSYRYPSVVPLTDTGSTCECKVRRAALRSNVCFHLPDNEKNHQPIYRVNIQGGPRKEKPLTTYQ